MAGAKTGGGKGTNQYQVKGASTAKGNIANDKVADDASAAASTDDPFAEVDGDPTPMTATRQHRKDAVNDGLGAADKLDGKPGLSHEEQGQQLDDATKHLQNAIISTSDALKEGGHPDYSKELAKEQAAKLPAVEAKLEGGSGPNARKLRKAARSYAQAGARTLEGRSAMTEEEKGKALTTGLAQFVQANNYVASAKYQHAKEAPKSD